MLCSFHALAYARYLIPAARHNRIQCIVCRSVHEGVNIGILAVKLVL